MIRYASLAILLVAFASPARADVTSETMLADFVNAIDGAPGWSGSAAVIRSVGDDTLGEGLRFRHVESGAQIDIKLLRLTALHQVDGGAFAASAIALEDAELNLTLDYGPTSQTIEYSIPTASVQDVLIPSTRELVFDPEHPIRSMGELYTLIAGTEFGTFSLPEVTGSQTINMAGGDTTNSTFAYRGMSIAGMHDGILGRTEAGPITMNLETAKEEGRLLIQIEHATAGESDIGALARILDPRAYENGRGDGEWRPIVSDVAYTGFSGTGPDGASFHLGSVTLSGFDGRQTDTPLADAFDKLTDESLPKNERERLGLEAVLEMNSAWRLSGLKMESFTIAIPKEQVTVELGSFSLAGLSSEGLESLALLDLRGSGPKGVGGLNGLDLHGLVFPDIRTLVEIGEATKASDNPPSAEQVRAMAEAMPRFSHFGMRGIALGTSIAEAATVGSFTIDVGNWVGILAETTDLRLNDFYIPRELLLRDPKTAKPILALGFERLVLGMSTGGDWAASNGSYTLTLGATVENGAAAEFAITVTGMTDAWIDNVLEVSQQDDSDAAMQALILQLSFVRAKLTVVDKSLVDRAFGAAVVAQQLAVDAATYKQQTREAVPFLFSSFVPPPLVERITAPVQDFLGGGKTLVVELSPPEAMPLVDVMQKLQDPVALADELQLSITSR